MIIGKHLLVTYPMSSATGMCLSALAYFGWITLPMWLVTAPIWFPLVLIAIEVFVVLRREKSTLP